MTANICRNAAAIAFHLVGRITTGTPFRPQNVYRNGVPVRSGTTTPLITMGGNMFYGSKKLMDILKLLESEQKKIILLY